MGRVERPSDEQIPQLLFIEIEVGFGQQVHRRIESGAHQADRGSLASGHNEGTGGRPFMGEDP